MSNIGIFCLSQPSGNVLVMALSLSGRFILMLYTKCVVASFPCVGTLHHLMQILKNPNNENSGDPTSRGPTLDGESSQSACQILKAQFHRIYCFLEHDRC